MDLCVKNGWLGYNHLRHLFYVLFICREGL